MTIQTDRGSSLEFNVTDDVTASNAMPLPLIRIIKSKKRSPWAGGTFEHHALEYIQRQIENPSPPTPEKTAYDGDMELLRKFADFVFCGHEFSYEFLAHLRDFHGGLAEKLPQDFFNPQTQDDTIRYGNFLNFSGSLYKALSEYEPGIELLVSQYGSHKKAGQTLLETNPDTARFWLIHAQEVADDIFGETGEVRWLFEKYGLQVWVYAATKKYFPYDAADSAGFLALFARDIVHELRGKGNYTDALYWADRYITNAEEAYQLFSLADLPDDAQATFFYGEKERAKSVYHDVIKLWGLMESSGRSAIPAVSNFFET